MFIAVDADPSALRETAWRAGRKLARGGLSNLICIAEPLDVVSAELRALADRITIILPWGNLLRAVAAPEIDSLRHVAHLCLADATLEIVFSYDEQRDARLGIPLGAAGLDEPHIAGTLPRYYERAGLRIVAAERAPQRELADYETTWAKRLAFGRPRPVWRLRARYTGPCDDGS